MPRAILHLFTCLFFSINLFGQEPTDLPEADPNFLTDEYELIVLDGDTVLRSKITKEVYNKNFRKRGTTGATATFSTDWMNAYWDTKTFNPYREDGADEVTWPVTLSFLGETFTMPVEGKITSRYGWRRGRPHKGIDIDLVTGDNVMAAIDGKVRFARYYSGFGNCVVIRHNNGLETIYAHLSKILVKPDTYVYSGQVIGKGGNTGRSRGSHLHFEARWFNNPINPEYLFDFENTKFFTANQLVVDNLWADPRKHRSYKKSNIVVKQPGGYLAQPAPVTAAPTTNAFETTAQKETTQPATSQPNSANQGFVKSSGNDGFRKASASDQSFTKGEEYHVIARGETLGKIAKKYGTTVNELCRINGITKTSILRIGKQIRVR